MLFRGNFPEWAFLIYDSNQPQHKTKIRVRILRQPDRTVQSVAGGAYTMGTGLILTTPVKIEFKRGMAIEYEGVIYTINSVKQSLPDTTPNNFFLSKALLEYEVYC